MGKVIICEDTTQLPITTIGKYSGVCYNTDINNVMKNFKRGLDCLESNHGRTLELVDVYMVLDGYSAKVMREFYTHIGGAPTRLQESTRYIDYAKNGLEYVVPESIKDNESAYLWYKNCADNIEFVAQKLEELGIPKEDASMIFPLAMKTKVVWKGNLRTLIDMSHQRLCNRAYWEFRQLFKDIKAELGSINNEWKYITDNYFVPKCKYLGKCPEKFSCKNYK